MAKDLSPEQYAPSYVKPYLAEMWPGFQWAGSDILVPLEEYIVELALDAWRMREKLPAMLKHERKQLDWLEDSTGIGKPKRLYELEQDSASTYVKALNELEGHLERLIDVHTRTRRLVRESA
jgi:hypothetical protein